LVLRHTGTGEERRFERAIVGAQSQYRYNGGVVSKEQYDGALRQLNVLVKARNFLVFQGDVEAIASKSPKDFTAMLEEISGSNALADEYQEALEAKRVAEESTLFTFQKKKGINAEKKRFKEQKDEAERFQKLQERIVSLKQAHMLWQLFHINAELDATVLKREEAVDVLKRADAAVADTERNAAAARKAVAKAQQQALLSDKAVRDAAVEHGNHSTERGAAEADRARVEKHRAQTSASLDKVREQQAKQAADVKALQKDLDDIERATAALAARSGAAALPELRMSDDDLAQYHALQEEAGRATHELRARRATAELACKLARDVLAGLDAQHAELRAALTQATESVQQLEERVAKIDEYAAEHEEKRAAAQTALDAARTAAAQRAERTAQLSAQFDECEAELKRGEDRCARARSAPSARTACSPTCAACSPACTAAWSTCASRRRRASRSPSTVAMQAHLDSIVVDTQADRRCSASTISRRTASARTRSLPLDALSAKPLNETLRSLVGARLAFDVIKVAVGRRAAKAVQYAVGNAVVADSVAVARASSRSAPTASSTRRSRSTAPACAARA
jgi:structural maintenance of chromosome 1